ncbi:MAG TPA: hypothetical protein VMW24_07055 [Sedimentisphaerales bacterium]|nr:hypothetical protein [Sedimentisphaerales bacterium]
MSDNYAKVFRTMYTGSLYGAGMHVFAVWGWVLAHKNVEGLVEVNPRLVAAELGGTVEQVEASLEYLMAPDPESRSTQDDGRRLRHIEQFEYEVVNHDKYVEKGKSRAEYWRKWRKTRQGDPDRKEEEADQSRARMSVYQAIQKGRLPAITSCRCVICGSNADVYHHYNGYQISHELDVIAVCNNDHKILHGDLAWKTNGATWRDSAQQGAQHENTHVDVDVDTDVSVDTQVRSGKGKSNQSDKSEHGTNGSPDAAQLDFPDSTRLDYRQKLRDVLRIGCCPKLKDSASANRGLDSLERWLHQNVTSGRFGPDCFAIAMEIAKDCVKSDVPYAAFMSRVQEEMKYNPPTKK